MRVTVRKATADDAATLAAFRWDWRAQSRTGTDYTDFVRMFSAWVVEHLPTHVPFVAVADGDLVGMAWLMIAERVPSQNNRYRRFGDVQSVYVVPDLRDGGVGTMLLNAVLAEARDLGLEHVTVHSSDRAVPFYERLGFDHDRHWLRWGPESPGVEIAQPG